MPIFQIGKYSRFMTGRIGRRVRQVRDNIDQRLNPNHNKRRKKY